MPRAHALLRAGFPYLKTLGNAPGDVEPGETSRSAKKVGFMS